MSADKRPLGGLHGTVHSFRPCMRASLPCIILAQSHAKPRRAGMGSLYLDSSRRAPTEFWSEELEEAGNERVSASF